METSILINLYDKISTYTLEYNNQSENIRMSSVGFIIRINPRHKIFHKKYENLLEMLEELVEVEKQLQLESESMYEILFLQRSQNQRDVNSGEVCLPGGKCDHNESDYIAVIRQVQQQTGIRVSQRQLLGKVPSKPFFVRRTSHSKLFVTTYLFLITEGQVKLNFSQMSDYKWIGLKEIMDSENKFTTVSSKRSTYTMRLISKIVQNSIVIPKEIEQNFIEMIFPSVRLGFKIDLWGLTFHLVADILRLIVQQCRHILIQHQYIHKVQKFINHSTVLDVRFKPELKHHQQIRKMIIEEFLKQRTENFKHQSKL